MSKLQDTFAGQQPEKPFKIKRADLLRIFQIGNPKFFAPYTGEEVEPYLLSNICTILKTASSQESVFFEEGKTEMLAEVPTIQISEEPDGGSAIWVDYNLKNETSPEIVNRSLLLIAGIPLYNTLEGNRIIPHFIMTGKTHIENGIAVYTPDLGASRCSLEGSDKDKFATARNISDFKISICYAEEAARCIFAGIFPDHSINQGWIAEENETLAAKRYDALLKRTQDDFERELRQREKAGENYEMTMPIPEVWQMFDQKKSSHNGQFCPTLLQ